MAVVLVIDDDERVRVVVRRVLEAEGHQVLEAEDGRVGVDLVRDRQPDLMITDVLMPGKEGIETIRDVRRFAPRLPVIAMSGGGRLDRDDLLHLARSFGADATLQKPFRPAELKALTRTLLSGSSDGA